MWDELGETTEFVVAWDATFTVSNQFGGHQIDEAGFAIGTGETKVGEHSGVVVENDLAGVGGTEGEDDVVETGLRHEVFVVAVEHIEKVVGLIDVLRV